MQAGCNVVAVEKDERQFVQLESIVMEWKMKEEKEDNPEEEEKRHDEFGKWLEETQAAELPPELQLKVAEDN